MRIEIVDDIKEEWLLAGRTDETASVFRVFDV